MAQRTRDGVAGRREAGQKKSKGWGQRSLKNGEDEAERQTSKHSQSGKLDQHILS